MSAGRGAEIVKAKYSGLRIEARGASNRFPGLSSFMHQGETMTKKAPPRPCFAIRLARVERLTLEAAAATRELPLSTYIRRVSLSVARQELADAELQEMAHG